MTRFATRTITRTGTRFATRAAAVFALSFFFVAPPARAQQPSAEQSPETARAIALYRRGDAQAAAELLKEALKRNKNDADGWYYFGLALNRSGRAKEARKAFERAIELRPDYTAARVGLAYALLLSGKAGEAESEARRVLASDSRSAAAHYVIAAALLRRDRVEEAIKETDAALALDPKFTAALVLKGSALANLYTERYEAAVGGHPVPRGRAESEEETARWRAALDALRPALVDAAAAFEKAVSLEPNSPLAAEWREQAETLRAYAGGEAAVHRAGEVTTKAVITLKPEPAYPAEARSDEASGVVRLRAVLAADGQVRNVFVMRSPDSRLARAAVAAARRIKFAPAVKDGRKVSQFVVLEYAFNIY